MRQKKRVPFNIPTYVENEAEYILDVIKSHDVGGDGKYTKKCSEILEKITGTEKVYLTTSGTSALDIAALALDLKAGDEVIMPSYTFSSTANAVVSCGATPVFVDIRPDTMNIDENKIESAITNKTRAIFVVHYAGVSCEMDTIMNIAKKYKLKLVEDAAQALFSSYKGMPLGTLGDFGCYSFHETKNITMGEGGAILVNKPSLIDKVEVLREKGTDRTKFYRGQVDKYTWVDFGDSWLPSELNAAYLYPQLIKVQEITRYRQKCWERYRDRLSFLGQRGIILPYIPKECTNNGHMFYIKTKDIIERTELINFLDRNGVSATFHYIPLHSAPAGNKFGRFDGIDEYTTIESKRLLRLPMHCELTFEDVDYICDLISVFYEGR